MAVAAGDLAATGSGVGVAVALDAGKGVGVGVGLSEGTNVGWSCDSVVGIGEAVGDGAGRVGANVAVGVTPVHAVRARADNPSIAAQCRGLIKQIRDISIKAWNNVTMVQVAAIHQFFELL